MMKSQYKIFYSWQSDNIVSKRIIKVALEAVVKQLNKEGLSVEIVEGGGGEGFINIEDVVRMKIRKCDLFIGDVTPVGNVALKDKLLPNANVMYELGIATESMTAACIIAVALKGDWAFEKLPFDFNHHPMVKFDENGTNKLAEAIRDRITSVITKSKRNNERFFSQRLLNRNISSRKYMPNTYIEDRDAKGKARIFVAPIKMYAFLFDRVSQLNFTLLNRRKQQNGQPFNVQIKIKKWDIHDKAVDLEMLRAITEEFRSYLIRKAEWLDEDHNWGWRFGFKVKRLADKMKLLNKQIMVVTSSAGQGKTNFVCDLVNNVLKTDGIPYIFVNAYELSAENIAMCIAQEYNFIGNGSLEEVLLNAERYCQQQLQYFIIVIDGLNEHSNQRLFKNNLLRVLHAVSGYRHVKVLMTCRKEFFKVNFQVIENAFQDELIKVELGGHRGRTNIERNEWECIEERYASNFNVTGKVHPNVEKELKGDMLLLRIFFESFEGKDISGVNSMNYTELFGNYFNLLCGKIQENIEEASQAPDVNKIATNTFSYLFEWMITKNVFRNIPLQEVMNSLPPKERSCFHLFINSNLILQIDMVEGAGGLDEVINFTYDEMRDYLIVRHLIKVVYKRDHIKFWELVETYTKEDNILAEGVKRYLFLYSKNYHYNEIYDSLRTLIWFGKTFVENIWYIKDDNLTDEDIQTIKDYIKIWPKYMIRTLVNYHWEPWQYKKLNLNTLFEVFEGMSDNDREKLIDKAWPEESYRPDIFKPEKPRKKSAKILQAHIENREKNGLKGVDLLRKLQGYLVPGEVIKANPQKNNSTDYALYGYDMYRYLMVVHKGNREEFLDLAGVKNGFSKQMMGDIYDAIFAEAMDVNDIYENYFKQEYKDLGTFLSMHYSIPQKSVDSFLKAIANPDYRLIDFSSIDYGNDPFDGLFFSDEMFKRFYNWLNWRKDEDKN